MTQVALQVMFLLSGASVDIASKKRNIFVRLLQCDRMAILLFNVCHL